MKNKNLLFVLLSLASVHMASAQDIIVKKDGSTVLSKVMEIGSTEVKYKKWSNQDGPLYTIAVSELLSINYENGEKETFDATPAQASTSQSQQQPQAKSLGPDARNAELIQLYNKDYHLTEAIQKKLKPEKEAKTGVLLFKVDESSIMSNEELEMSFVTCMTAPPFPSRYGECPHMRYNILLKNKTDKIIYVDLGTCVRNSSLGEHRIYFTSEEVGVGKSSGGGVSVGLGAVAGALGIGGVVGAVASGIGVGQGNSTTVNKSYTQQRILSIPPQSTVPLTNFKYLESGKTILSERAEEFNYNFTWEKGIFSKVQIENVSLNLERGIVNQGEEKEFAIENSPISYNYVITYSTTSDFSTYSTLTSTLYASKLIGLNFKTSTADNAQYNMWNDMWGLDKAMSNYIENYSHSIICGLVEITK